MDIRDICHKIIDNPLETGWLDQNELAVFLQELTLFYSAQPNIARFRGKALFVGDIHGDIDSMLAAFKIADQESANIAFLGDIVDRGSHNVECVNLLISREYVEPGRIFYIRGNHEFRGINSKWGFMESVLARYPESVYDLYNEMFKQLPVAALQNNKVFGVHGGLSRHEDTIEEIEALDHGNRTFRDEFLDMLWNDPATEPQSGFEMNNTRGIFYTFGQDVFDRFMEKNNLTLFIRGHTKQTAGYRYFFDKRLISIFSSGDHYKDTVPSAVLVQDHGGHEIVKL